MGNDMELSDNWDPIIIERGFIRPYLAYTLFLYVFVGLFVAFIEVNIRTIWVLVNIVFGFFILINDRARKYYARILGGFLEPRIWLYALLNVGLIFAAVLVPSILASGTGTGSSATNPFVSSIIFLLFIIPIVPLFADAETKLFQGWIIKKLNSRFLVKCRNCGKESLPVECCDICGSPLLASPARSMASYMPAIFVSAFIFALAHVLLVGSWFPMVIVFGGLFLGWLYVKEGAMTVAKVHMLYDYLVIGLIILGALL